VEFREEQEKADEKNYGDSMESESEDEDEETILDIVHRNMVESKFPGTQRFFLPRDILDNIFTMRPTHPKHAARPTIPYDPRYRVLETLCEGNTGCPSQMTTH
jgi:hypothetical protein